MGQTDRIVRVVLGVGALAVALLALVGGVLSLSTGIFGIVLLSVGSVLGLVGIIFIVTSVISFCPIYKILKVSTYKEASAASKESE